MACGRWRGSALPTVLVVATVMLLMVAGLMALWAHDALLMGRNRRIRQARADIESAYTVWRLNPSAGSADTLAALEVDRWGLYERVRAVSHDSLARAVRLFGLQSDPVRTLWVANDGSPIILSGATRLRGILSRSRACATMSATAASRSRANGFVRPP